MIPAAHDQGHAFGDSHAANRTGVGGVEGHPQTVRTLERHHPGAGEWSRINAARSGKYGAVGEESDQAAGAQLGAQSTSVFNRVTVGHKGISIQSVGQ